MANTESAKKRARQAYGRWLRNRRYKGAARTQIKKARKAIDAGDWSQAEEMVRQACQALDKAAAKGVIHKNNAARRKSRLVAAFKRERATTEA